VPDAYWIAAFRTPAVKRFVLAAATDDVPTESVRSLYGSSSAGVFISVRSVFTCRWGEQ